MSKKDKRREALRLGKKDMSFAEIMQDGYVKPEDVKRVAGKIYDEAQRLITLVGDVMEISRLDEGRTAIPCCSKMPGRSCWNTTRRSGKTTRRKKIREEQKKISKNEEARARESWTRAPFARYATMSSTNSA